MNAMRLARTSAVIAMIGIATSYASADTAWGPVGTRVAWGSIAAGEGDFAIDYGPPLDVVVDSPNKTTGTDAVFNFNPALNAGAADYNSNHFFQVDDNQFRLEVDTDMDFTPVDYNGATGVPTAQPISWAITGNHGGRQNSVFRGDQVFIDSMTPAGTDGSTGDTFYEFSGRLVTDGKIHWYGPTTGAESGATNGSLDPTNTSDLTDWQLGDTFYISGTLLDVDPDDSEQYGIYRSYGDGISIEAVAVPAPAASVVGLVGFGLLALRRRRRGEAA